MRNLIREGKIPQISSMMQMGSKLGMKVMKDEVYKLLEAGTISRETAKDALADGEVEQEAENGGNNDKTTAPKQRPKRNDPHAF